MRNKCKGRHVTTALASMCTSNRVAAQLALKHKARACTDVTGFGLLGHLVEMCKASGVVGQLNLGDVPFLPGATDCVEQGIFSSLQVNRTPHHVAARGHHTPRRSVPLHRTPPHHVASRRITPQPTSRRTPPHHASRRRTPHHAAPRPATPLLQPQNIRLVRAVVREASTELKGARYNLLFDPQTAGGLLVSIPKRAAKAYVKDLHNAGYTEAAVVGEVQKGTRGKGPECIKIIS